MKEVSYLYLNGLGDGREHWHEKLALHWWRMRGTPLEHFQVNWYSEPNLDDLVASVSEKITDLLETTGRIALIGSSASGSLALNALRANRDKDIVAIIAHGRLRKGNYAFADRVSLENRAKTSKTFFDSVCRSEALIPALSEEEKQRVLVLTQLTDLVVPVETMGVPGASTHKSLAFGHSGGFIAHMVGDRGLITEFAQSAKV